MRASVPAPTGLRPRVRSDPHCGSARQQIGGKAAGGALLLLLTPSGALRANASSFLFSATVIRLVVADHANEGRPSGGALLRDSLGGAREVFRNVELRRLLPLGWLVPMFSVAPEALAAPYVFQHGGSRRSSAGGGRRVADRAHRGRRRRSPTALAAPTAAARRTRCGRRLRSRTSSSPSDPSIAAALVLLVVAGACSLYSLGLPRRPRPRRGAAGVVRARDDAQLRRADDVAGSRVRPRRRTRRRRYSAPPTRSRSQAAAASRRPSGSWAASSDRPEAGRRPKPPTPSAERHERPVHAPGARTQSPARARERVQPSLPEAPSVTHRRSPCRASGSSRAAPRRGSASQPRISRRTSRVGEPSRFCTFVPRTQLTASSAAEAGAERSCARGIGRADHRRGRDAGPRWSADEPGAEPLDRPPASASRKPGGRLSTKARYQHGAHELVRLRAAEHRAGRLRPRPSACALVGAADREPVVVERALRAVGRLPRRARGRARARARAARVDAHERVAEPVDAAVAPVARLRVCRRPRPGPRVATGRSAARPR